MSTFTSLVLVLTIIPSVHCYSGADVRTLIADLFVNDTANVDRPSSNFSAALNVSLDVYLLSINTVDVVSQMMEVAVYMEIQWTDEYMTWNPTDYNDITYFLRPQEMFWRPDISLRNGLTALKILGYDELLLEVYNNI